MADPWKNASGDVLAPGRKGTVVTPGSTDLPNVCKGLVVLAAGNATVIPVDNADNETLAFVGLNPGDIIPYQVRRVTAATASLATIDR